MDVDAVLSSVMSHVEQAKRDALSPMDERSLRVEKQAKDAMAQLHDEIGNLRRSISDLEHISDLEDHIDFLQVTKEVFGVKAGVVQRF